MEPVTVGILGCGSISDTYLTSDQYFDAYEVVACANSTMSKARAKADEFGITAYDVEELLSDQTVEVIVNLTPPSVHAETTERVLDANKHVYVEKPLAATSDKAKRVLQKAREAGLFVGSAPDTFLGASLQTVRSVIDEGIIGQPIGATAIWHSPGHESWHPNPDLFYKKGGGPLFDVGPYYLTALISLLGPAKRVTGSVAQSVSKRTITSTPRRDEMIDVEVPTYESGIVDFEGGAIGNILLSFDTQGSTLPSATFEIYGTEGSMNLPNPTTFTDSIQVQKPGNDDFEEIPLPSDYVGGRGIGIVDLAYAIHGDWEHRTSGELALHALEILEGIRTASRSDEHYFLDTRCERPKPIPSGFPDRN